MRIVSMVPSWTETLVSCGAEVIARTRFCLHPSETMKTIPVVGGTKDISWDKVTSLGPDLVLLDREENPKSMADEAMEKANCRFHATHVTSVSDVAPALAEMADLLEREGAEPVAEKLKRLADRWRIVELAPRVVPSWKGLPGLIEWIQEPVHVPKESRVVYVIWKNPWMAAAPGTFIGSVLERLGWTVEQVWPGSVGEKYPRFELGDLRFENDVLLCSSEPFPFHKKREELIALGRPCAVVDGESFSWFGLRSLVFLEKVLSCGPSSVL